MKNRIRTLGKAYVMLGYDVCWNVTNKSGNTAGFFVRDMLVDSSVITAEILWPYEKTVSTNARKMLDYFQQDMIGNIILGNVTLDATGELLLGDCSSWEYPDGFVSEKFIEYFNKKSGIEYFDPDNV